MDSKKTVSRPDRKSAGVKSAGLAGAWLGAIAGSIPMIVASFTVRSLAIPFSVFIPVVSQYLYRQFSGYRKRRTAVITITTLSLAVMFFAKLIGESISIARTPSWQEAAAEYGVKPFEFAWTALLMAENFRLLIPGLIFSAAVCITGVFVVYPFIKEYADLTGEEENELKDIKKKAEAEAVRIATEQRSEKRKSLPKRLEHFGSDDPDSKIVPRGEYRVEPASLQKKYLTVAAAAAIVLGALLFAGCVYMTIGGSLQYILFALVCLALCLTGVRVIFSVTRYIDVDGMSLRSRGIAAKITEFTFDDISSCERDDKRFYIKGKDGELLAFFNLGWQNAKRLFNAMEGYGIVMVERLKDL